MAHLELTRASDAMQSSEAVLSSRVRSAVGASMSNEPVRPASVLADAMPFELECDRCTAWHHPA